jgi:rare lipoprotein A
MPLSNKNLVFFLLAFVSLLLLFTACAKRHAVRPPQKKESGLASWYGPGFHGRRTASGERFDQKKLTAAHRTLPFGTEVKITNPENEMFVVVKINDRGPALRSRIIDLSKAAAKAIGILARGVAMVEMEVLE